MKNVSFMLSVMILFMMGSTTMANPDSPLTVTSNSNSLKISMNSTFSDIVEVKIKDQSGIVLYEDKSSKTIIEGRKYNVSELEEGRYYLEVTCGDVTELRAFTKKSNEVLIESNETTTIIAPVFKQKGDYVDVKMMCGSNVDTSIRFLDEHGNLLYTDHLETNENFEKRFNLSNLPSGVYTFAVYVSSSNYYKVFTEQLTRSDVQVSW